MYSNEKIKSIQQCCITLLYVCLIIEYFYLYPISEEWLINSFVIMNGIIAFSIAILIQLIVHNHGICKLISRTVFLLIFSEFLLLFMPEVLWQFSKVIVVIVFVLHFLLLNFFLKKQYSNYEDHGYGIAKNFKRKEKVIHKKENDIEYQTLCCLSKYHTISCLILLCSPNLIMHTIIVVVYGIILCYKKTFIQVRQGFYQRFLLQLIFWLSAIFSIVLLYFGYSFISWIAFLCYNFYIRGMISALINHIDLDI